MNILDPIFLSHVVLRFSPTDLPGEEGTGIISWSLTLKGPHVEQSRIYNNIHVVNWTSLNGCYFRIFFLLNSSLWIGYSSIEGIYILFLYHLRMFWPLRLGHEVLMMEYYKRCPSLVFGWCCLLDGCIIIFRWIFPSSPLHVSLAHLKKGKKYIWNLFTMVTWACFGHVSNMGCFEKKFQKTFFWKHSNHSGRQEVAYITKQVIYLPNFWLLLSINGPIHNYFTWRKHASKVSEKCSKKKMLPWFW
jgi:hypothetical protein